MVYMMCLQAQVHQAVAEFERIDVIQSPLRVTKPIRSTARSQERTKGMNDFKTWTTAPRLAANDTNFSFRELHFAWETQSKKCRFRAN